MGLANNSHKLLQEDPQKRFNIADGGYVTLTGISEGDEILSGVEAAEERHRLKLLAFLRAQGRPVLWSTLDSAVPR